MLLFSAYLRDKITSQKCQHFLTAAVLRETENNKPLKGTYQNQEILHSPLPPLRISECFLGTASAFRGDVCLEALRSG